jgi:hypothetical protein
MGLDPAYMYHKLVKYKIIKEYDVINWHEEAYGDLISEENWSSFERNFACFLYIFSVKNFEEGLFKPIEKQLIEKLKSYGVDRQTIYL